jgi:hypothetical protein
LPQQSIAAETVELALDANGNTAKILIPKDDFTIEEWSKIDGCCANAMMRGLPYWPWGYRLKEAQRAVQVGAIKGVVENQESQCTGSHASGWWDVLIVSIDTERCGVLQTHTDCKID